ncbi:uncharacterized protein [Physcomitrium patens]|uniref:uncharacterized protein isoform X1 n=1 Tax=Physcomitrium patens TaxID=3218 RepID=UPI000D16F786|nr:transmembrane protein 258-like isoform X1 [Physcomitrium patens]XP_024381044.1 transmembrane protein 258-like isoform X1 [Physcomitrium patens]XP_024381045.1 transmembrane protein 258-like isoform X1 [Physcomitrium patens]|eukprot:XP_024381043.1 transmembrane protein 258-like isoform X1 [Physcomitrella patens]
MAVGPGEFGVPLFSPVSEPLHPLLAVLLITIGLLVMASFFIGLLADHAYLISSLSSTMTAALLFIFVSGKYQAHGRAHTIKQQRKLYTKGFGTLFLLLWTGVYV